MNQPLSAAKLAELTTAFPAKLTKREKLLILANLVEQAAGHVYVHSNLEHWGPHHLADPANLSPGMRETVFSLAAGHEPFRADGLGKPTVGGVLAYLELTVREAHPFSCDCGGHLPKSTMAERIRNMAG